MGGSPNSGHEADQPPGQSTREFNVPSLFAVRLTAPFFHDGSAATLKDAVEFYNTDEFVHSPAMRSASLGASSCCPRSAADDNGPRASPKGGGASGAAVV